MTAQMKKRRLTVDPLRLYSYRRTGVSYEQLDQAFRHSEYTTRIHILLFEFVKGQRTIIQKFLQLLFLSLIIRRPERQSTRVVEKRHESVLISTLSAVHHSLYQSGQFHRHGWRRLIDRFSIIVICMILLCIIRFRFMQLREFTFAELSCCRICNI